MTVSPGQEMSWSNGTWVGWFWFVLPGWTDVQHGHYMTRGPTGVVAKQMKCEILHHLDTVLISFRELLSMWRSVMKRHPVVFRYIKYNIEVLKGALFLQ